MASNTNLSPFVATGCSSPRPNDDVHVDPSSPKCGGTSPPPMAGSLRPSFVNRTGNAAALSYDIQEEYCTGDYYRNLAAMNHETAMPRALRGLNLPPHFGMFSMLDANIHFDEKKADEEQLLEQDIPNEEASKELLLKRLAQMEALLQQSLANEQNCKELLESALSRENTETEKMKTAIGYLQQKLDMSNNEELLWIEMNQQRMATIELDLYRLKHQLVALQAGPQAASAGGTVSIHAYATNGFGQETDKTHRNSGEASKRSRSPEDEVGTPKRSKAQLSSEHCCIM